MRCLVVLVLVSVSQMIPLLAAPAPIPFRPDLELCLKTSTPRLKGSDKAVWEVWIVNRGKKTVTLVQPGDGSDCGWRTPIIEWGLGEGERKVKKADEISKATVERKPLCLTERALRVGRCGNINRLRENEVIELAPGKEVRLNEWVGPPPLSPGKHKVVVRYFNLPDHPWKGEPLGGHDEKAMRRVKNSLKVALESNPVEIMVEK